MRSRRPVSLLWFVSVAAMLLGPAEACPAAPPAPTSAPAAKREWKSYDAQFYALQTDVDEDMARETVARLIAMAREYSARTKGFAGGLHGKMIFSLYTDPADYHAAGGLAGSAGMFNGKQLMATAKGERTWHVVQHEGFHQFARQVITTNLPIWVNEGMAEYFGEAVWTGGGMVAGVIPPARLKRVQGEIRDKKMLPFIELFPMTGAKWNSELSGRNYDEAWSVVHFLAHADDGKYQGLFTGFINDLARGTAGEQAFLRSFGKDTAAFQKRYEDWWLAQPEDPSKELYTQATVETLTNYLARGWFLRQRYATAEEFFQAAGDGKLAIDPAKNGRLWLPPKLLADALAAAGKLKTWSLETPERKLPKLKLTEEDGTTFTGSFGLGAGNVENVKVEISKPKPAATKPTAGATSRPRE